MLAKRRHKGAGRATLVGTGVDGMKAGLRQQDGRASITA
jgi:hypothetical protein